MKSNEYKYAQNVWLNSMEKYLTGKDDGWYETPSNVSTMLVDPISGKPATDQDKKKKLMYFIKGSEPNDTNTVFDEKFKNSVAS